MHTRIVLTLALVSAAALVPAQAQQFVISTYVGGPSATIPVLGVNTAIGLTQGVTTDAAGNVYFDTVGRDGVFRLDRSGVLTRIAGNSREGYAGDGGPAADAQFFLDNPYDGPGFGVSGVAVDSAGNVYIADSGNNRVRKISTAGIITTVAGNGISGYSGDGGPATSAQLDYPTGLAVDGTGNLYIVDYDRVRKVSPDGNITTTTTARVGSAIAVDSAGNLYIEAGGEIRRVARNGAITTVAAENPSAMTVDRAGNIYLAETGRVRKISSDGIITTVASAQFGYSSGLAVDSTGNLYIAGGLLIRKVSPDGVVSTVAGNGECCYSGDGGPARAATLNLAPWGGGMAVDGGGNLYIADAANQRVRKISPSGTITTVAGNGMQGDSGDGGPATSAQVSYPSRVAVDSIGNLYIGEQFGSASVRKVSPFGTITTVAKSAGLLAVDIADNLYYLDGAGVNKVSPSGIITTLVPRAPLDAVRAAAVDRVGNLYFAELGYIAEGVPKYRVRKLSPDGSITIVAGGDGTPGYSGDGGPAVSASIDGPSSLAVDSAGNLYIADCYNTRIRKVSPSGIITTVAGNGGFGYSGDGGPATSAQFGSLSGLTMDGAGNLYAADQFYNAIRLLQPASSSTVISGVVNAASILAGGIAPGEIVAVTGFGLGPAQLVSATLGGDGLFGTQLAGTTVLVNGIPAQLVYTWATQVAAVIPDSLSGDTAQITVIYQGKTSASFPVPVAPAAPGIFTQDATGRGHAAMINQNGAINTPAHWEGDVVTLFVTGTGQAESAVTILGFGLPANPISVEKGAVPGVTQIKVAILHGQDCDTPVVIQVRDASSQPGVTIAVDTCI